MKQTAALLLAAVLAAATVDGSAFTVLADSTESAVLDVQDLIDALPAVEELESMGLDGRGAVYERVQAAYDAYTALTNEQQAQISGAEKFDALFAVFSSVRMVNALAAVGNFNVNGGTLGQDYSYSDGVLTILTGSGSITPEASKLKADISISANLNKTYDGTGVSLDDSGYSYNGNGTPVITWYSDNSGSIGSALSSAPEDSGTYWVKVSAESTGLYQAAEAAKRFTIRKRTAILVWSGHEKLDYTGKPANVTATVGNLVPGDTCTVTVDGGNEFSKGPHRATAIELSNSNYALPTDGTAMIDYIIGKATAAVVTAPTANTGLTYTGSAQPLVAAGTASGGTMVYSTDGMAYAADIPTGTAAGTYTVWYKVQGDRDHYDTDPESLTVVISQKELTISLKIKDKQYDGTNTAEFDGTPALLGIVNTDRVTLTNGTPAFDSVGVSDSVPVSMTDFSISGAEAGNYVLVQPVGITGRIYNDYAPAEGTDYTADGSGWLNQDFVVTAKDGFSLSMTDTADGIWTDTLSASDETADGTFSFYVRNNTTGAISNPVSESYRIDKAAPWGEIKIGSNGWRQFLNTITFGHFFKDIQTVSIHSGDALSGVGKVEYASSDKALSLAQVQALTGWREGSSVNVTPEDGKQFIYYARITDRAGNVTYLSTDGAEYDLTAPAIAGLTDGGTYCIRAEFTANDKNLKEVKLGTSVLTPDGNGVYTLSAGKHTVTATDEAGNTATVTVTVNAGHTGTDDGDCTTEVKCSFCGTVIAEAKEHDFGGSWQSDGNRHWQVCRNEGCTVETMGSHSYTDGICTVCGEEALPAGNTDAYTSPKTGETDGPGSRRLWAGILSAVFAAAAAAGGVLPLSLKRRKRETEE